MTLLRRIAQLVQDLRTLNVLTGEDHVKFIQSEDRIKLYITLTTSVHEQLDSDILSIDNAVRSEFLGENGYEYESIDIWINRFKLSVKY